MGLEHDCGVVRTPENRKCVASRCMNPVCFLRGTQCCSSESDCAALDCESIASEDNKALVCQILVP